MSIRIAAPGKLNVCLYVGPTRDDGYHELVSLFDAVSLHDTLVTESGPPPLSGPGPLDTVVCPGVEGENLVTKAFRLCRDAGLLSGAPLHVRIDKRLPVAAGMGGGSADAGAALRLVSEVQDRPLADYEAIAFALGADVPSQLRPGAALVLGAGERIVPVDPRCLSAAKRAYVIVVQPVGLATADVFAQADRIGVPETGIVARENDVVETVSAGMDLDGLCELVHNALEPAILGLRPELAGVTTALREAGARAAAFTGSGPTAFGVFDVPAAARDAAERLCELGHQAFAAEPVGPEFAKPETVAGTD